MTQDEFNTITVAVRGVDSRLWFAINVPTQFERDVQGIPDRGVVLGHINGKRFAAPYSDGFVRPFDIGDDIEKAKADALAAARELREFWEKNL